MVHAHPGLCDMAEVIPLVALPSEMSGPIDVVSLPKHLAPSHTRPSHVGSANLTMRFLTIRSETQQSEHEKQRDCDEA